MNARTSAFFAWSSLSSAEACQGKSPRMICLVTTISCLAGWHFLFCSNQDHIPLQSQNMLVWYFGHSKTCQHQNKCMQVREPYFSCGHANQQNDTTLPSRKFIGRYILCTELVLNREQLDGERKNISWRNMLSQWHLSNWSLHALAMGGNLTWGTISESFPATAEWINRQSDVCEWKRGNLIQIKITCKKMQRLVNIMLNSVKRWKPPTNFETHAV